MNLLNYFIDSLLVFYSLYYLTFVLIGIFDKDLFGEGSDEVTRKPKNRFAVFVPAHNEEKVISKLLSNLESLDYPSPDAVHNSLLSFYAGQAPGRGLQIRGFVSGIYV